MLNTAIEAVIGEHHIVASEALGSYQGDYYIVYRNDTYPDYDGAYYLIVAGYGSCSGCDAWEALDGRPEERATLVQQAIAGARKFEDKTALIAHLKDDTGNYWYTYDKDAMTRLIASIDKED